MENQVFISVIMPVFNSERYLKESLKSLLDQTFKSFEIICIDDGSTDSSVEILKEYSLKNGNIKILHQQNGNAGNARNNALKFARGQYVHFFDSDDVLSPDAYRILYDKIKGKNVDCCFFQYYKFNVKKIIKEKNSYKKPWAFITNYEKDKKNLIKNVVVPWNKIIKRQLIEDNNLKYDEIVCANDRSFYFKLILCAKKILIIPDRLIYYRINNESSLVGEKRFINFDCHFKSYYSTMEEYKLRPVKEQNLILDVTLSDMFYFHSVAPEKYKENIENEIRSFFDGINLKQNKKLKYFYAYRIYKKEIKKILEI